ncbi:MAG: hypothetical protein ACRDQ6_21070, partial [Pseudonocardiaceae bacterium]
MSCAERHLGAATEAVPGVDGDPVGVRGVAGTPAVVGATAVVSGVLAGPAGGELEQAASASASTLTAAMQCPDLMNHRSTRDPYLRGQLNLITTGSPPSSVSQPATLITESEPSLCRNAPSALTFGDLCVLPRGSTLRLASCRLPGNPRTW